MTDEAGTDTGIASLKPPRLDSVDLLRGLVMVLMALDHTRDFFTEVRFDPLDLTNTNAALFMTRWITHFCAPVFVFLAGTGAFLSTTRGKTKPQLSKFLLTRGLWLVLVEVTVVRFGWLFNLDYTFVIGQVIWAIGWSMVVLSVLVLLSLRTIAVFGIGMIILHNALDGIPASSFGVLGWLWSILHTGDAVEFMPGHIFAPFYPLIPWIGVMAAGYAFGSLLQSEGNIRRKTLTRLGLGMIIAFVILRASNLYGDPAPWSVQNSFLFTVFSFIDCEKYPPSLLFLLMTLGPAILVLPLFEKLRGSLSRFFIVFGRVPMFYYVIHLPLIHLLGLIAVLSSGMDASFMMANIPPWEWPANYGFGLPVVYGVWLAVVFMLYPLCRWFSGVKRRSKNPVLSYF